MRQLLSFISLAVVGLVCGAAIGFLNTSFVPNCGEDCASERLGNGMLWGLALLMAFPAIGRFAFSRIGEGNRQTISIAALLSLATVVPAAAIYGYELHQRYWKTAWKFDIPNVDFSLMTIATKPVMAIAHGTTPNIQIKAWERCAFGRTACDARSRTVEAICLGSGQTVLINEADWPAFQRIKVDDLPEVHGLPDDMNLCLARSPRGGLAKPGQ